MSDDIDNLESKVLGVAELNIQLGEFDLHTADTTSCMHYRTLRKLYVRRVGELIDTIQSNGDRLRTELQGMLRDS
jgi:hypothetical protein